ncbi:hypothetical protein [Faecalibacillus intestinalis]|uniref:hypothetical protein n=1 Tax=Faecalibacillus intestinalis TaxID=1982626 RepID=UPI002FD9DF3E
MPKLIDKDGNELLNLQMSTDEHWTGKYWIDGKKIYEKIITWTGLSVGVSTINHSISNLNELLIMKLHVPMEKISIDFLLLITPEVIAEHSIVRILL